MLDGGDVKMPPWKPKRLDEKHLESQTTPSPALQPSSFLMFLR